MYNDAVGKTNIEPPKTWDNTSKHYSSALNSEWYKSITKLQNEFIKSSINYYSKSDMVFMFLPMITNAISSPMGLGSDSKPVEIEIRGKKTHLVDSMQFYLEYACRLHNKNCYYLAPSFRGESSDNRHLNEFLHSEAEIIGNLDNTIEFVENYIKSLCKDFLTNCIEDINKLTTGVDHINKLLSLKSIPRCTFDNAVDILENNPLYVKNHKNKYRTITNEGEKKLINHFNDFVWLTYPDYLAVPFYQKYTGEDMKNAVSADLLMGIGETVGAGERVFTSEDLIKSLKYHNVSPKNYEWYIKMKRQKPLQTSGFGMGIERFLLWLINHDDIRDIPLFPRLRNNTYF